MKKVVTGAGAAVLVGLVATGIMAVATERILKRMLEVKNEADVVELLSVETEQEESDLIGFFMNKDIFEIKNNGITYEMKKLYNGNVELKLIRGKRVLFCKRYTDEEWDLQIRSRVRELL